MRDVRGQGRKGGCRDEMGVLSRVQDTFTGGGSEGLWQCRQWTQISSMM